MYGNGFNLKTIHLGMKIVILTDPDKKIRPSNSVRADVAWKLFMPDSMGDIPREGRKTILNFTNWLWTELGDRLGTMNKKAESVVYMLTPDLSGAARELLLRVSSMWADEVHIINGPEKDADLEKIGENLWTKPVLNVISDSDSALAETMTQENHNDKTVFLMPSLGSNKAFMRTYSIKPGSTYARLHSHSAVEEHYLVLKGRGSLRYGSHKVGLEEGDLVSKPIGPDNYSQFIADEGEEMKVLDIEVWPDNLHRTKDIVLYPDHKEILMRGEGWYSIVQEDSLLSPDDFGRNYDAGYERNPDGSWSPKNIPGFKTREE